MNNKTLIIVAAVAVLVVWFFSSRSSQEGKVYSFGGEQAISEVVSEENGEQVIRVLAKVGYTPKKIVAKAGMPTRLEIETNSTYDCSAAFTIPSINYRQQLPATGLTEIEIPVQKAGDSLVGMCTMGGMYSFTVNFIEA